MATAQGCTLSLFSGSGEATQQGSPERVWAGSKKRRPDVAQIASIPQKGMQVVAAAIFKGRLPSKRPCSQHPCLPGPVLAQCPQTPPRRSSKEPQQSWKQPRKRPREGRGRGASQPAADVRHEGKAQTRRPAHGGALQGQSLLVRPRHELGMF